MATTSTKKKYYEGIGSRKTSNARVRIYEGKGASVVNGKPFEELYKDKVKRQEILEPLIKAGLADKMYFSAKVSGGGVITGWADAIKLGIARAIVEFDDSMRQELSSAGLLTRDPRKKERKKYFLIKARKRPQFSKR